MRYGLETYYENGGLQISPDYLYLRAFQQGTLSPNTFPGTLFNLAAGQDSPLVVFRGGYANACFEAPDAVRLFCPFGVQYKMISPVPFPLRGGYGLQAMNEAGQVYFDNEGDYFSVDAIFNLTPFLSIDGVDDQWFNIPISAPPNGRLRFASVNYFDVGRGASGGFVRCSPLLINVTNTNIQLRFAFNGGLGWQAPADWFGDGTWDGTNPNIYIVTGY